MDDDKRISAVLDFWFEELAPRQHWLKDAELDAKITERFGSLHQQAALGELWLWRATAKGRLAEIIVLDQFSRNIYRGQAQSFACDAAALVLAQEAVRNEQDKILAVQQRAFLYMPYMHSESLLVHDEALRLFGQSGLEDKLDFEQRHRAIIERFGRYPHRNDTLGRISTPEEEAFLSEPGSSF